MKQILHFVFPIFFLTIAHSHLNAQILTPTGHYKFDNSLEEFYSGIIPDTSAAYWSFIEDEINSPNAALKLAGGYFIMPDPGYTQFGLGDFSISLWFKRTESLWPAEWIFYKGSSEGYFRFRYNGFFDQMVFYFRPDMDTNELVMGTASQTVGLDNWNLYTMTIDRDDKMKMYFNGNLVQSANISHVATHPADFTRGNFRLGCRDIAINDLLFFDKALDSSEVSALFNHELDISEIPKSDFFIYPNPTYKVLKIKSKEPINESYQLYSSQGILVQTGRVLNNEIDIEGLSAGTYVLRILKQDFTIIIR